MTLTVTIRLPPVPALPPGPARPLVGCRDTGRPGQADTVPALRALRVLLPLAEPAVLLGAGAAGLGPVGQMLLATALRSTRLALTPRTAS
jgi:hypothetical protein